MAASLRTGIGVNARRSSPAMRPRRTKPLFALDQATVSDGRDRVGRGWNQPVCCPVRLCRDGTVRGPRGDAAVFGCPLDPHDPRASFRGVIHVHPGTELSASTPPWRFRSSIQRLPIAAKMSRQQTRDDNRSSFRDVGPAPDRVKNAGRGKACGCIAIAARSPRWTVSSAPAQPGVPAEAAIRSGSALVAGRTCAAVLRTLRKRPSEQPAATRPAAPNVACRCPAATARRSTRGP